MASAETQYNLGSAWANLLTSDRAANLKKAINCYEAALEVYTEEAFPRKHAMATENLAQVRNELGRM